MKRLRVVVVDVSVPPVEGKVDLRAVALGKVVGRTCVIMEQVFPWRNFPQLSVVSDAEAPDRDAPANRYLGESGAWIHGRFLVVAVANGRERDLTDEEASFAFSRFAGEARHGLPAPAGREG